MLKYLMELYWADSNVESNYDDYDYGSLTISFPTVSRNMVSKCLWKKLLHMHMQIKYDDIASKATFKGSHSIANADMMCNDFDFYHQNIPLKIWININ